MVTKTKIIIKNEGIKLEDITEGNILVFSDGREELVKHVNLLEHILYTRAEFISNEDSWVGKFEYKTPMILPTSKGEMYNYNEQISSVNMEQKW